MAYVIDTNTVIQAKNDFYAFDIAPSFWIQLKEKFIDGECIFLDVVISEICNGEDEIKDWVIKQIKQQYENLIAQAKESPEVFENYRQIANLISFNSQYKEDEVARFLSGADPWIIAAAKTWNYTVVTFEKAGGLGTKKVKIPDICKQVGVPCIRLYDMMRQLGMKL